MVPYSSDLQIKEVTYLIVVVVPMALVANNHPWLNNSMRMLVPVVLIVLVHLQGFRDLVTWNSLLAPNTEFVDVPCNIFSKKIIKKTISV